MRGPKDGFSETLRTNTSLIPRRIKDTQLWIETKSIGRKTKTDVAIAYIKDVANDNFDIGTLLGLVRYIVFLSPCLHRLFILQ